MKHTCEFKPGRSESVETCRCGKFRFTKKWLEEHPSFANKPVLVKKLQ
jgi:hypothetical protein